LDIYSICVYADKNPCTDGTHSCTSNEICINTPNGYECQSYLQPSMLSMVPEKLTMYNKKPICDPGYVYNVYEQKCKGNFENSLCIIKINSMGNLK